MKVRSGSTTDTQLATFLDRKQSTIAMWRARGAVPEKAALEFEKFMRLRAA